jgi:glucokinase
MTSTRHLGIDLGGTNIKSTVVELDSGRDALVIASSSVPTPAGSGPDAVTARMIEAGRALAAEHGEVATAGVGVPGLFDRAAGRVEFFPNLPGAWGGFPLRDRMGEGLGLPATMINDARAFVLAEAGLGAGRGSRTIIGLTLGTGVGGGVIVDGRLHLGATGTGGEVGHQTVAPDGPICGCGNRGCAEVMAQASTIARLGGRATAEEVFAGAESGDEQCREAVASATRALGIALANMVTVLVPDVIVIGGGIAGASASLLGPLRDVVRQRAPLVPPDRIRIVAAELGAGAGAIGAALAGAGFGGQAGVTSNAGTPASPGRA